MAKRRKESKRVDVTGSPPPPAQSSLASLFAQHGLSAPGGPDETPEPEAGAPGPGAAAAAKAAPAPEQRAAAVDLAACGRLTLGRETKKRRGKTVTVLAGAGLSGQAEALARALGRALGCGASVEPEAPRVLLQGDMRTRAEAWLRAHGARDVRQIGG